MSHLASSYHAATKHCPNICSIPLTFQGAKRPPSPMSPQLGRKRRAKQRRHPQDSGADDSHSDSDFHSGDDHSERPPSIMEDDVSQRTNERGDDIREGLQDGSTPVASPSHPANIEDPPTPTRARIHRGLPRPLLSTPSRPPPYPMDRTTSSSSNRSSSGPTEEDARRWAYAEAGLGVVPRVDSESSERSGRFRTRTEMATAAHIHAGRAGGPLSDDAVGGSESSRPRRAAAIRASDRFRGSQ